MSATDSAGANRSGRAVLVFGIISATSFVIFAILARLPVPSWDEWEWVIWLRSEPVTPARLFLPHNEHVIPIARLLFALQYEVQGTAGTVLFLVSLTLQLAVGVVFWREITGRWTDASPWRRHAMGSALLTIFSAWQLHSVVFGASVLFPMVLFFGVLAFSTAQGPIGLAASLGAMLTTTNGLAVPALVAVVLVVSRSSRALAAGHGALALTGAATYLALVSSPTTAATGGAASLLSAAPEIAAYFFAVFGSFVTYINPAAGVLAGVALIAVGALASVVALGSGAPAPRIERFAIGVMTFATASGLMAAIGRAQALGLDYAAQSRYATYAMAYWAALLLLLMSLADRNALPVFRRLVTPATRWPTMPACVVMLGVHAASGVIWIAKADNMRPAGLAVAAGVQDVEWLRTLHESVEVIHRARELAAADGDRTVVNPSIGTKVTVHAASPSCGGSLSLSPAPEGPALRLSATLAIAADAAWILDRDDIIVGLAAPGPMVDQPNPTGAEVFSALRRTLQAGSLFSNARWIGFAPVTAARPLTFAGVTRGQVTCRSELQFP